MDMTRVLAIDQPFDLAVSLEMGQAFRWRRVGDEDVRNRDWGCPPVYWRTGGGWYSGVLEKYLVHIRQTDNSVEYRVGGADGELHDVDLSERLSRYFRLDDPIEIIYGELRRNQVVGQAIDRYQGIRLLRQDRWECVVSYLCSATNNIPGIQRSVEKLALLSRRTVRLDGEQRHIFPSAQQIADEGLNELKGLNLGLDRADYILSLAGDVARDPAILDRLAEPDVPCLDAVRELDRHRGIGPKIASCAALMSLDKLDAFPVDRWVQRALAKCDLSEMPTGRVDLAKKVASLKSLTEPQQYTVAEWARGQFGEYAGYAGQYLFHWVEPIKKSTRRGGNRSARRGA